MEAEGEEEPAALRRSSAHRGTVDHQASPKSKTASYSVLSRSSATCAPDLDHSCQRTKNWFDNSCFKTTLGATTF